jgi:hypothetical protein
MAFTGHARAQATSYTVFGLLKYRISDFAHTGTAFLVAHMFYIFIQKFSSVERTGLGEDCPVRTTKYP